MTTKRPKHDHIIPYLVSSDLLPEILIRLPLKSLFRFRLVCKRWQSIITCNPIIIQHLLTFNQNTAPAGLLILSGTKFDYLPFIPTITVTPAIPPIIKTPGFREERCNILQSCNGLLLCSKLVGGCYRYYVCNPTTKKFVCIPAPVGGKVVRMGLAFSPADSPDYKVVAVMRLFGLYGFMIPRIYIYSSQTGLWKVSSDPFTEPVRGAVYEGVYWNDAIHWISAGLPLSSYYFNFKNGSLLSLPNLPVTEPDTIREWNSYYCGESRGHLYFVESKFIELNIYEMKRDHSEWFLKHTVKKIDMAMGEYDFWNVKILSVVCGEHDDVSFLVLRVPGKIIRYNLVSRTCEKLHDIEDKSCQSRAFNYIESLCPV